jgi:hypothetical protein
LSADGGISPDFVDSTIREGLRQHGIPAKVEQKKKN